MTEKEVRCAICRTEVTDAAFVHRLRIDTTSQYGTYTIEDRTICSDCAYQLHLLWASPLEVLTYQIRTGRRALHWESEEALDGLDEYCPLCGRNGSVFSTEPGIQVDPATA